MTTETFSPGLPRARPRPRVGGAARQRPDLLVLRPLGGPDDEAPASSPPSSRSPSATFPTPTDRRPRRLRAPRDCCATPLRLGFRAAAGPFRCFGRIAVEPRAVPARAADDGAPSSTGAPADRRRRRHRQDHRGRAHRRASCSTAARSQRLAVLCPPHLAEQWQAELREKFHIEAELVLPTHRRAAGARTCAVGESLFDRHPFTVVSTDFIKTDRRREDFLRTCPEFVIVDEAHTLRRSGRTGHAAPAAHELVRRTGRRTPTGTWSWSPPRRTAATRRPSARCWPARP